MDLSLVIPAYNEACRIEATLRHVCVYLLAQPYSAEIIVVDDGSSDQTASVVRSCQQQTKQPITLVSLEKNCGKGHAVRVGMRDHAQGAIRIYYDADGSTPIEELGACLPYFKAGADIVIGSRPHPGSRIRVRQAWYRQTMGRIFNALLHLLRLTPFQDTQCGFKGFTRAACDTVFSRQTLDRFSFDAELLYIAKQHQLNIVEMPVQWRNSPVSRVHPLFDAARMFWDLLVIRKNALIGRYQ